MDMIAPLSAPDNPHSWEQCITLTDLSSRLRVIAKQRVAKVDQSFIEIMLKYLETVARYMEFGYR